VSCELSYIRILYFTYLLHRRISVVVQLNQATSWLDGNFIYGRGDVWASALRSFVGGQLATLNSTANFPALNQARVPLDNYPSPTTNALPQLEDYWGISVYTQGEVTSQNLWSRYDRNFVGINNMA